MDRVTQDENTYQADLEAREQRVTELKSDEKFLNRLQDIIRDDYMDDPKPKYIESHCWDLLTIDPKSPSCTMALKQVVCICERAHAAMIDGHEKLFKSLQHKTLATLIVEQMAAYSAEYRDDLFIKSIPSAVAAIVCEALNTENDIFDWVLGEFM